MRSWPRAPTSCSTARCSPRQPSARREVILYVGSAHHEARHALKRALFERRRTPVPVHVVDAPVAYVAGEESAAVHYVNAGDARPTVTPPRPYDAGIDGAPIGARVGEVAAMSGVHAERTSAVLHGGCFGHWCRRDEIWGAPLDPITLRSQGVTFGAGVMSFLGDDRCGVSATATLLDYMAAQSAAQCGPCVFGLRSLADTTQALAAGRAGPRELALLERWLGQIRGRHLCRGF